MEARLHWHLHDSRRRPFADLLLSAWQRCQRPMVIAKASHVGSGRGAWLDDVAGAAAKVTARDVPLQGLCLYPLVDRHDWDDESHWHNSGRWDRGTAVEEKAPRAGLRTNGEALAAIAAAIEAACQMGACRLPPCSSMHNAWRERPQQGERLQECVLPGGHVRPASKEQR